MSRTTRLCDAVQFAHDHGVIHRDLKPANVLFDERDQPYLSDFGLAKLVDSISVLTGSLSFLGTPHYSAPEVAGATAAMATVASDTWSLGAMLHQLLSGHLPFEGTGLPSLLRRIVEDAPAPLPAEVPRDLAFICAKALRKDPSLRYTSAAQLADDLRRWLEGRSILARQMSAPERLRSVIRRNPLLSSMAAALLIALGVAATSIVRESQASRLASVESLRAEHIAHDAAVKASAAEATALLAYARTKREHRELLQRDAALASALRSHRLRPSAEALDEMISLLALPSLEHGGSAPYRSFCLRPDRNFKVYAETQGKTSVISDFATHQEIWRIPEAPVTLPGPMSPSGQHYVVRAQRHTSVWDLQTHERLLQWPGIEYYFSGDGRWLVTNAVDKTTPDLLKIKRWDLSTKPPTTSQSECAITPSQRLSSVSPDGSLCLLSNPAEPGFQLIALATGEAVRSYPDHAIYLVQWQRNGQAFFIATLSGHVVHFRTDSSTPVWSVQAHNDSLNGVVLFDADQRMMTHGCDHVTKIWNLMTREVEAQLAWPARGSIANYDGSQLWVDRTDLKSNELYTLKPATIALMRDLPIVVSSNTYNTGSASVVASSDGKSFTVTNGYNIHHLDTETLAAIAPPLECGLINGFAMDRALGHIFRYAAFQRIVEHYPLSGVRDTLQPSILATKLTNRGIDCDATTHLLLVGDRNGFRAYLPHASAAQGAPMMTRIPELPMGLGKAGQVSSVKFAASGRFVAWSGTTTDLPGKGPSLHIAYSKVGQAAVFIPLSLFAHTLVITSDETAVIAANLNDITCYDLATLKPRWQVKCQRERSREVSLATAGNLVAATLEPTAITLLDVTTGRPQHTLRHPVQRVIGAVGLSPDGQRLLAVAGGLLQLWRLDEIEKQMRELTR
ncbi:MAG: serine/threonine-protein kinase [Verrucomicrobia bacterium]|nr:serine/threonine-protein kinase [Verrucomicrobiota bacterium]